MTPRGDLRRRKPVTKDVNVDPEPELKAPKGKPAVQPRFTRPSSVAGFFILIICFGISFVLMYGVNLLAKHNLETLYKAEPTPQQPFVTENAMEHIRRIAAKRRWVGTLALEESLQYIQAELLELKPIAERNGLELEVEFYRSGSGSYLIDLAGIELILAYSNISSVVARLRPAHLLVDTKEKSLLINAHVDSAAGAPGASDNVVGVGVAMEVARCIASSPIYEVKRPIVFLFNGGEEAICAGAHGFIKQHKWVSPIAAHINLESLGPGDSYHLFRLGPHNSWLIEAFANSVSLPSTSVTASDLFDAKVIPGETDFRIFDEYGGIPGFDFVLLDNGYVYHTVHDSIENVDPLGVKHGGIVTMELALEMAGTNDAIGAQERKTVPESTTRRLYAAVIKLSNSLGFVKDPEHPRTVFFDVLQLKTIVYEEGFAGMFNIIVLFLTVLIWFAKLMEMNVKDRVTSLRMFGVLLGCLLASFASATFASLVYVQVYGAKLRWYGSSLLACLMFAPPALFGTVSAMSMLLPKRLSSFRYSQMLFASTAFHFVLAVLFMSFGFMTSYLPILMLLADNICALQGEAVHPVIRHVEISVVHAVLGSRIFTNSLSAMLPLLGRVRIDVVPHDSVAALIVTYLIFVFVLQPTLPALCYYARSLRKLQALVFFCSLGIAAWLVALGPLLGESSKPNVYSTEAPKRLIQWHFYSPQQKPESVMCIGSQDCTAMNIDRMMSQIFDVEGRRDPLPEYPTWGTLKSTPIETYQPFGAFLQNVVVFEADKRPSLPLPKAKVVTEEEISTGWNVTFLIEAPDSHQLTVRFPTGTNSSVVDWSLEAPLTDRPEGAWIRYVGSFEYVFWLVLRKGDDPSVRPKHRMAVTSCRLGTSKSPSHLSKLLTEEWESSTMLVTTGIEVEL